MSTVQAPLLWVPLKTTSDVSYAPSIRQTIIQTYQESADSYKEEIAALDRCRQDALRGSAGSDITGRDLLYKYFGQLELLELRFPEVRVPFPWKDAFTGKEISQLSLAYEKASVIFNIAATLSSLAAQQNRTSTEGIRRAFHNFRCAAGMFTYINDNFLHAPSTDLSREVVKVLVQLMIAQATEVFVERMTEEKEKKPFGLRARVSTQAAFLYGSIIEDVKELVNKGIFERSWTWLVQCKHKYFVSLAQYQRSLADSASSKHGDALARLQIAETAAKEASRFATSFSTSFTTASSAGSATLPSDAATSLLDLTRTHLALCNEAKVSEQRDNDLIYHEALPSEAALPPIEKSSVGEPIAIQEVYGAPEVQKVVGQDIFVRLVPLSVHQSSSLYSEEKAKLIRTEGERCETADTELVTALEFAGLPASLDKFNDFVNNGSTRLSEMTEPPNQVLEWAEAVQHAKEVKPIEKMWDELTGLRNKVHHDLDSIEQKLDTDARDCEQMRVKYDHLWEQQPSSNFTKAWRQSLKSHREALEEARKSDQQIDEIWQSAKTDLGILADPTRQSVRRLFTENMQHRDNSNANSLLDMLDVNDDESEMSQMKNMITAIQENISRLQAIKKERNGVLQDLKERIQADDISQLLILNRKAQNIEPALFAAELEKFQAHSGRISATIHLQTTAIQELTAHYKSLVDSRRGKDIQERWTNASKRMAQATNRLQAAYQSHEEVRSALLKGIHFYRETQTAVIEIQRQAESFLSNRVAERMRMVTQAEAKSDRKDANRGQAHNLDHQMARMNLANSSLSSPASGPVPPPLPPPPRQWQQPVNSSSPGPPYQTFSPYSTGSDRTSASATQAHYSSPSPPSADPYASLASFGSINPSTTPVSQNLSGPVHPQVSHQYSGQAQASIPQQYSGQAPPPPPSAPPQRPAQFHHQHNAFPANAQYDPVAASAGPPKPALPPPPPPVTYQSAVAQAQNPNSSWTSSQPSEALHHHAQQPGPSPMHYPSAPQPRPPVGPLTSHYHQNSTAQTYVPNHQFSAPTVQAYHDPRNGMSYGSATQSPQPPPKSDPIYPNHGGWQQGQQHPNSYTTAPHNSYYPNPAPPPPPPPPPHGSRYQ
ncbi:uncharacterized protein PGTG_14595 [Puccinia graminis f. sp. tritici CRL 75-36-700-3]|uniref:BRO domain-containing protein 1 n=1 Tax=Puccinia graminis f. sp. tritici (strain CRL 75-36-700-3 / race SCCL) TaxID=418459 RepID=E3KUA5_PUCGT|nr:uncharacterized protein PGTG_14595 [Puccinia graminis f. sp. tritici CRL 75-36-700-3]EFP87880.2 hypothetical protein PGTG_14595 [Puccinia graminis f. sp. tritici CRL 75-36-700-3]